MVSELGSDFVFGITEPLPLYRDNKCAWADFFDEDGKQHKCRDLLSQMDGKYIVKKMMIKANGSNYLLQHRCWLVLLDTAVGCPCEFSKVKLNTIQFLAHYNILLCNGMI